MGKIISIPDKKLREAENKVIRIMSYIQSNLVQLADYKMQLLKTKREIEKYRVQLKLQVIKNVPENVKFKKDQ